MVRNFRRSGQEPDRSLMSQGENAYLVLRGVFHVSPPALGGLSIDGKLTFSNNAYLKLPTEWIMLHGELAIGSVAAPLAPRLLRCGRHHGVNQERDTRILWFAKTSVASLLPRPGSISGDRCGFEGIRCH